VYLLGAISQGYCTTVTVDRRKDCINNFGSWHCEESSEIWSQILAHQQMDYGIYKDYRYADW